MELFIDTANIAEIKEANDWGVISGVTTNPSLIAKEGRVFEEVVKEITDIADGPVSAEVVSPDAENMVKEAMKLSGIHKNVVIKIPMTKEGLKAVNKLSQQGIRTNVTLVFSAAQALLAARAGATFVSPFVGRINDIGADGDELIADIAEIFELHGIRTKIIAASIRDPKSVIAAAKMGAHIATVPFGVLNKMFVHPLTEAGIEKFTEDWNSRQEK